jgi:HlyD family secretion protein
LTDRHEPGADAGKRIFRDAALERLNSPEQLDQRIGLIPPAMRLLAASATVIILAALVWGVFGTVPTRTTGRGVLIADKEGNFAVSAVSPGLVLEMLVQPGDRVVVGAEIARIEQRLLAVQIDNGMAQVARLEANLTKLKAANAAQIHHSEETARRQQSAIDGQIAANEVRRERLRELVAGYEALRSKGMISQTEFIARQDQYDETVLQLANGSAKKIEIEATAQMKRDDLADIERQKEAEIDLKKAEVDQLRVEKAVGSIIKAPLSGVVQEVRVGRGGVISAGAVLVTIGPGEVDNVEMLVLLSGERRKRVAVGMDAYVMPDGTKREEYGSMRGRVIAVSENEMSNEHIEQILQNAQLTNRLIGDGSALIARVKLFPSRTNPSGYAWWSGKGPPYRITLGSVANLDIIIAEVRPISLVIPALRKLLSING